MASSAIIEIGHEDPTAARYESLIRLTDSIRAQRAPGELFDILVEELRQIVPFDAIAQFDETANKVNWHLCESLSENAHHPALSKEDTVAWWVYQNQRAVVILRRGAGDSLSGEHEDLVRESGLQSLFAVPLTTAHRRLGSLVLASKTAHAYSAEEVRFVSLILAGQIALAMDDAMNFEASLRALQERLELLLALTNRIVANLDLRDHCCVKSSASIRRVMQCDGVGVALPDAENHRLRIFALDLGGSEATLREGFELPGRRRRQIHGGVPQRPTLHSRRR